MEETSGKEKNRLKFRFGLAGYLFCCLGLVAALPVLVLGVIQVPRWEAKQLEEVDREGQFVAEALVHGIGQIVDGHVRAVETLAGQVELRKSFDPEVLQEMVSSNRLLYGGFSFMYVAGIDGISIVADPRFSSSGKPTSGTNYSTRDYYKELIRTRKTATSRVQIGENSGVPNIQIVSPIWDEEGEMIAFAEGSLDLRAIQAMADRLTRGISGLHVAVLDHEGRVIAHPEKVVRDAVENLSHLPIFQKPSRPGTGVYTGVDDKGTMMRASVAGVNRFGLDWTVTVYRPEAEVQTQAAEARQNVLAIAGIALLAGLGLATMLAGGLARPIEKLASIATAVGGGNFSEMPPLPHAWVPHEMASLQTELREMVLQLKDYTTKLEQRIEERTAQLEEVNSELESFVYSVSHDLKAPVISLYGMATMLKKKFGDKLDSKGEHYLQRLMSNAGFMEQLITDLLNFSRVGKHEYQIKELDVDQVVHEALDHCDSKVRETKAQFQVESPLPSVYFDHTSMCKIYLNFFTNAMKFMGDQSHPKIEVGGQEVGNFVEFYVKDNGIGIDERYQDKVFGVFQRLKEVSVDGTGIGLAVVKKIIDMTGGKVWFESNKGEGTTFFFKLPKQGSELNLKDAA